MRRARARWRNVRHVAIAIGLGAIVQALGSEPTDATALSSQHALAEALSREGLLADADDIQWLSSPTGWSSAWMKSHRALVRAHAEDGPSDLYLVHARLSPENVLLDVGGVYNITRTSSADESLPIVHGDRAAYVVRTRDRVTAVHVLDLAGREPDALEGFSRRQRWQTEIADLQRTGQPNGLAHDLYVLDPIAKDATVRFLGDHRIEIVADGRTITLDAVTREIEKGRGWVRVVPGETARPPSLVPWAVDRVRALSWFGSDRMQYVKAVAFTGLDLALRARNWLGADTSETDIASDLAGLGQRGPAETFADPVLGWPPKPLKPVLEPPISGEGQWISLAGDPFIGQDDALPPAFVTTFIRTDEERKDSRVFITLWDPRQVALHMEAGTVEPESATGQAGSGLVPRAPEVVERLVGGFNGGFQALHGEWGMQAAGTLYLPPKAYAATILEMRDGATAFGSWPDSEEVPENVLSYRQNMTALVENGKFNPWGRTWWGGTPPGWEDTVHTTRSGVCMTKDGFVGYFWGGSISHVALANAMLAARCDYGVHLDMNPGLAGFEFYNVIPEAEFAPIGRPLQMDWEFEGPIRDLDGYKVRSRRMIKSMGHVNFPQWIRRDTRDFFYLTRRHVLPGRSVPKSMGALEKDGHFQVSALPQHGFPYAVAQAKLDLGNGARAIALRVDPRTVTRSGSEGTNADTPTVVSVLDSAAGDAGLPSPTHAIVLSGALFVLADSSAPSPIVRGVRPSDDRNTRALACIDSEDGFFVWLELDPKSPVSAQTTKALRRAADALGCLHAIDPVGHALVLGRDRALFGGKVTLGATPTVRWVRREPPSVKRVFEDTPIVPLRTWYPLQAKRIRYFKEPKDAGADAPGRRIHGKPGSGTPK